MSLWDLQYASQQNEHASIRRTTTFSTTGRLTRTSFLCHLVSVFHLGVPDNPAALPSRLFFRNSLLLGLNVIQWPQSLSVAGIPGRRLSIRRGMSRKRPSRRSALIV